MRFIKYIGIVSFFVLPLLIKGQITIDPELPIANKPVTITFNSAEDSRLGYFTGDLYAHTGVGIDGKGDWQHVIGSWGNNSAQPKLTYLGNGIYQLTITPDINSYYSLGPNELINNMSFVFRSSNSSQQTNDLFINVFQPGLSINLDFPNDLAILELNSSYTFSATSTDNASLLLTVNGEIIASASGTKISKNYSFSQPGSYQVIAKAEGDGEISTDTAVVLVRKPVVEVALPQGAVKGISYPDNQSVRLVLWAPKKSYVFLLCELNDWKPNNDFQLKKDGDYFWIELSGLETGKEYPFQYYIDGDIKIADPYTEKICDPWNDRYITDSTYPGLIDYPEGKTDGITSIFQPGQQSYEWQHPTVTIPAKEKQVIYELHIRDFTKEHTYEAVREKLDYLENLNINVLELMPVNEFEGNSSWGYNPSFYFAPDKYYGPKNKLKQLIDECHSRGIAVVIDMVLNHSYGQSPFVQMYWNNSLKRPAADNPWYNETSNFQNPDAQWGYDFNHDSEPTRELVDSINSFWINNYHVDGFRFDFTKGFSNTVYGPTSWGSAYDAARISNLERMTDEIWKRKKGALVICEHLADNSEEKVLADYGLMLWGNMNYNYGESAMGYTANSDLSWGYYVNRGWSEPNLVTYQESHDEERLVYKCETWGNSAGSYSIQNLDTALDRFKMNALFHLPIPGPKMIWQFGELGYDISIDENGRTGEKPVHWEYVDMKNRAELFKVYAALNMLKQNYSEFSSHDMSYSLKNKVKTYQLKDGDNYVVAVGNFDVTSQTTTVTYPKAGKWYNYFAQSQFDVTSLNVDITLNPGEYLLFSTREFDHPEFTIRLDNNEIRESAFSVFPNPTNGLLNLSHFTGVQSITLLNAFGKKVFWQKLTNSQSIQIGELPNGVYLYQLKTSSGYYTGRILKQ